MSFWIDFEKRFFYFFPIYIHIYIYILINLHICWISLQETILYWKQQRNRRRRWRKKNNTCFLFILLSRSLANESLLLNQWLKTWGKLKETKSTAHANIIWTNYRIRRFWQFLFAAFWANQCVKVQRYKEYIYIYWNNNFLIVLVVGCSNKWSN